MELLTRVFETTDRALLIQQWGDIAINYAPLCHIRHYANRSLQILRSLQPPLSENVLSDIMARLADAVSNPSHELQGYACEILLTLDAFLTTSGCPPPLPPHPIQGETPPPATAAAATTARGNVAFQSRMFWTAVVLLESDYEHEFALAETILLRIVACPSFDDPSGQQTIEQVKTGEKRVGVRWVSRPTSSVAFFFFLSPSPIPIH